MLRVVAAAVAVNSPSQAKVGDPIEHPRDLNPNHSRGEEGGEDVPPRADAAEAREVDPGCAKALGDVPRDVDPDHVKGDALRPGPAQRGEPMAHLLETDSETPSDHIDVVPLLARCLKERPAWHQP